MNVSPSSPKQVPPSSPKEIPPSSPKQVPASSNGESAEKPRPSNTSTPTNSGQVDASSDLPFDKGSFEKLDFYGQVLFLINNPHIRRTEKLKYPKLTDLEGFHYHYKSKQMGKGQPCSAYFFCGFQGCTGKVLVRLGQKSFNLYEKHNHPAAPPMQGYGTHDAQSEVIAKEKINDRITQLTQQHPLRAPYEVQATIHEELKGKNVVMPTTREIQVKMRNLRSQFHVDDKEVMKFLMNNRAEFMCYAITEGPKEKLCRICKSFHGQSYSRKL